MCQPLANKCLKFSSVSKNAKFNEHFKICDKIIFLPRENVIIYISEITQSNKYHTVEGDPIADNYCT